MNTKAWNQCRHRHKFHTLIVGAFWASESFLYIDINWLNWYPCYPMFWHISHILKLLNVLIWMNVLTKVEDAFSASLMVICLILYVTYTFDTCSWPCTYAYIYMYIYICIYFCIYIYYNCGCNHCVYYTWICWFLGTPVPSIFFANSLISWGPRLRPAPSSPGLFQVKLQMSGYDFKLVTWWNNWISYDTIIGQWGINNNRFSQEQGMWDIMG
jgi:hypothetical protein